MKGQRQSEETWTGMSAGVPPSLFPHPRRLARQHNSDEEECVALQKNESSVEGAAAAAAAATASIPTDRWM